MKVQVDPRYLFWLQDSISSFLSSIYSSLGISFVTPWPTMLLFPPFSRNGKWRKHKGSLGLHPWDELLLSTGTLLTKAKAPQESFTLQRNCRILRNLVPPQWEQPTSTKWRINKQKSFWKLAWVTEGGGLWEAGWGKRNLFKDLFVVCVSLEYSLLSGLRGATH